MSLVRVGDGYILAAIVLALPAVALVRADAPRKEPGVVVVTGTKLTFDPATCTEGQRGFGWALGSVRVAVLGHEAGQCVFDYQWEVEGAGNYQVHRVKVLAGGGPVVIDAARERKADRNNWSFIYTSFTREQARLVRKCEWGWFADLVGGS